MQSLSAILALAAVTSAAVISIDVGEDGIKFSPESTTAAVGDTLEFHFYDATGPHSVVHGSFDKPCEPATDAFFSGYFAGNTDGSEVFTVEVTSTDPIWYYCSAQRHCQNGMVGVINPPSGSTVSDYASAANGVSAAKAPSAAAGGTSTSIGAGSSTSSSSSEASSAAASSSSASESSSSAASESTSSSKPTSASSSGSAASSVSSSAAPAATSAAPGAAGKNDGKTAGVLAVVAGGLVALLA